MSLHSLVGFVNTCIKLGLIDGRPEYGNNSLSRLTTAYSFPNVVLSVVGMQIDRSKFDGCLGSRRGTNNPFSSKCSPMLQPLEN